MTIRVQTSLALAVALVTMGLASCDHYVCSSGATFGSSSCTAGPPGLGQNNGGNATAAFVFAVDQGTGSGGTIDGFTLDTSANTFQATSGYTAPAVPANIGGVGMVVAQKQYLYAGFGSVTNAIYGWTIDTSGGLTSIAGSPFPAPYLSFEGGQVGQGIMITDPAGKYLFVADNGHDLIYVYTIGSSGALSAGSAFSVPFPPENLATDGKGNYLYATDGFTGTHTGSEIAAFAIGSSGVLAQVPGSPFLFPMWQVQGEPTGQFLIGTSGNSLFFSGTDDLNLYVFSITQSGVNAGAIAQVDKVPTQYSPFSIAVQPNTGGNLVYSFSFNDTANAFNPTEGYSISSSGTLTRDSGSPFSNIAEGSWGQFDQSGAFLFDWSSFTVQGTGILTTQLAPFTVGSGGALTQPFPTLTLATPGFWVVTDPK